MKTIRILQMIGSLDIGGSQNMMMDVYRKLDRDKIQFDFVVDHAEQLYYADEIISMGGRIYVMPQFVGWNFIEIIKKWKDFFEIHSEYTVLHSHVRSYALIYLLIAKKKGLKTIIHSHSTSNGIGVKAIVKKILQFPLKYVADYLFACSVESSRWLFGKKAYEKKKVFIVPNAIDIEKYCFNQKIRDDYRTQLGVNGKIVVGHVGRLHEAKNHKFLLELFAQYSLNNMDSVLILVGEGELREEIEIKIAELKIKEKVMMLGNRNDVSNLMQAMDVFVFPSIWEGLPITVIEAQAAGLKCLISNSISEEVDISPLVERLPLSDINCWIEKMNCLDIQRKNMLDEIQSAGFDINECSKWLTNFYEKIGE